MNIRNIFGFKKFNEEASLKDNQGIPGSDRTKRDEPKYIEDVDTRSEELIRRAGLTNADIPRMGRMPTQNFMRRMDRFMQLIGQSQQLQSGNERELEELAEQIIRSNYGTILDNVDLDIKIVAQGSIDMSDAEPSREEKAKYQNTKIDDNLKMEIDRRKIANNITQGEAKNTKHILHSDECKDALAEINPRLFNLYDQITKMAEENDRIIPIEVKADMMKRQPGGFAGRVEVEWPEEEKDEEKEKEDLSKKILKDLEKGNEPDEEDMEDLLSIGNPKIIARALDFPMLLHETVKGIYELIAAASIPKDKDVASMVKLNVDNLENESEDFRYGPYIAADIRDFVSQNSKIEDHPNIREHVYGKMHQMETKEFLDLIKGILMKTPVARRKVDAIIDEIVEELNDYESKLSLYDQNQKLKDYRQMDDEETQTYDPGQEDGDTIDSEGGEEEDDEIQKLINQSNKREEVKKDDYSQMSQRELQKLLDDALDSGNYEIIPKIQQYLR